MEVWGASGIVNKVERCAGRGAAERIKVAILVGSNLYMVGNSGVCVHLFIDMMLVCL